MTRLPRAVLVILATVIAIGVAGMGAVLAGAMAMAMAGCR